jgi:hypothetical protein
MSILYKFDINEFTKRSKLIHGISMITHWVYNYNTHIKIICNIYFEQRPSHHMSGSGCQKCNESKGEKEISKELDS